MVVAALANEAGLLFSTIQKCSSISIDPSTCRLLLSPILHFSPFALFFNLFYLFFYGDNVEDVLGRFFHTVFFFSSGIISLMIFRLLFPTSMTGTVSSSAAVAAVMGLYLVLFPDVPVRLVGRILSKHIKFPFRFFLGFFAWLFFFILWNAIIDHATKARDGTAYMILISVVLGLATGYAARKLGLLEAHLRRFQKSKSSNNVEICPQCYSEIQPMGHNTYTCEYCRSKIVFQKTGPYVYTKQEPEKEF
tara:strand:+ start:146 stop:892 length:747 start_codon:yes stop_codon:yes gene_type:complete